MGMTTRPVRESGRSWGTFKNETYQPEHHIKDVLLPKLAAEFKSNNLTISSVKKYIMDTGTIRPGGFLKLKGNNNMV